jgi:hypothetical protein
MYHSWTVNLSWLLCHLKKGNSFSVRSDVVNNHMRTTIGKEMQVSAFMLEICTALKAGYNLVRRDAEISLIPSRDFDPRKCITNGLPGDGISPSTFEVRAIHLALKTKIGEGGNFEFSLKNEEKSSDEKIRLETKGVSETASLGVTIAVQEDTPLITREKPNNPKSSCWTSLWNYICCCKPCRKEQADQAVDPNNSKSSSNKLKL